MLALTAMSSFSDAHETPDIPLIAANLNRLVWSAQKQIWAVLRRSDTLQRLSYSLAATFLGRPCLSGDILDLGAREWEFVRGALGFYREVSSIIRDGTFRGLREVGDSYQYPTGHQIVLIQDPARGNLLVVWHAFTASSEMSVRLPMGTPWTLVRECCDTPGQIQCAGEFLQWSVLRPWSGGVLLLRAQTRL